MLWFPEWRVLVVDDEPDVLRLTELALRRVEVEGIPVRVFTAQSKAEAIDVISEHFVEAGGLGLLTVAFIDVVMETDTAGLELCDYIRNTMGNSVAQLYVRTGQPGIAPERDVMDRYDITGYFAKVEATEDKLYTLVKSGVRQYILTYLSLQNALALQDTIASSLVSQQRIADSWAEQFANLIKQRNAAGSGIAIWVGDTPVLSVGYDVKEAEDRRARLIALPTEPLSPMGETVIIDREGHDGIYDGLVQVPAGPSNPPVEMLSSGNVISKTNFIWMLTAWTLRAFGMAWEAAGQRAYTQ